MVCSSAPHLQAVEEAIPCLYKQEWKRPTLVWRRFKLDLGSSWEGHSGGMSASVGDENAEV